MPFTSTYPDVDPIPSPGPIHPSIGDIQLEIDSDYDILSDGGDSEFEIVPNPVVAKGVAATDPDALKEDLAALNISSEDETESAYGGIEKNDAVGTSSRVGGKDDAQDKDANEFKGTLNKGTDKKRDCQENIHQDDRYGDSAEHEGLPYEDDGCESNAKGKHKDDAFGNSNSVGRGGVNAIENGRNTNDQDDNSDLHDHQRARRSRNHPPSAPFLRPATPEFAFSPLPPAPIGLPKSPSRPLERSNRPSSSNFKTNHAYPPPPASRSGTSRSISSMRSYATARTSSSSVIVTDDDITAEPETWTSTPPRDLQEELAVSEAEREAAIRAAAFAGAALERERAAHRADLHAHETERRKSEERSSSLSQLQQRYTFLEHEHEETLGRIQRLHKALRAAEDARNKALLQNSALKAQNDKLQEERGDLQKRYVKLEKSHDVLHLCHESADQRRESLQQSQQELSQAHNELQKNHDELLKSHTLLRTSHRNFHVRHELLKHTHAELQNRHSEVQKYHDESQMHVDPPSVTFKAFPDHLQQRVARFETDFWGQDPVGRAMTHEASRVKTWRDWLQRAFLPPVTLPNADAMSVFNEVLGAIENYEGMRVEYLLHTNIHKVMRKIAALDNVPHNDKFHITDRADKHAKQWELMIEKAMPQANAAAATSVPASAGAAPAAEKGERPWTPANGTNRNSDVGEQVDRQYAEPRGFRSERTTHAGAGDAKQMENTNPSVDSVHSHVDANTSSAAEPPSWFPDDSTTATGTQGDVMAATRRHLRISRERLQPPRTWARGDYVPRERELTAERDQERARLEKRARRKAAIVAHDKVPPGVRRPSFTRLRGKPQRPSEAAKPGHRYTLEHVSWKFDNPSHSNEVNEDAGGDRRNHEPTLTQLISAEFSQKEAGQPEQSSSQFEDSPSVDASVKGDGPEADDVDTLQLYRAYCRSLEGHSETTSDPTPGRKGKERERQEQETGKDVIGAKVLNHAPERKDEEQRVGDSESVQVPVPRIALGATNSGSRIPEWNAPVDGPSNQALRRTPTIPPLTIPRGDAGLFSQNRKSSSGYGALFSRCAMSPSDTDAPSISLMAVVPNNPSQLPVSHPAITNQPPTTAVSGVPAQTGIPRTTALPNLPAAATVQRPRDESQSYRHSQITAAPYPRPVPRDTLEAKYAAINWIRSQRRRTADDLATELNQRRDIPDPPGLAQRPAHERTSITEAAMVGVAWTTPTAVATQAPVPRHPAVARPAAVPTQVPSDAFGANRPGEVNDGVAGTDRRPRVAGMRFAAHEGATSNGRPVTPMVPIARTALPAAALSPGLLQVPGQAMAVTMNEDAERRQRRGTTASDRPRFADSLHRRLLEVKHAETRGDGGRRSGVGAS